MADELPQAKPPKNGNGSALISQIKGFLGALLLIFTVIGILAAGWVLPYFDLRYCTKAEASAATETYAGDVKVLRAEILNLSMQLNTLQTDIKWIRESIKLHDVK